MHVRMPKNFVLEERLERYAKAIEVRPATFAGRWAEACWPLEPAASASDAAGGAHSTSYQHVCLDLGCGKGAYLVEMARRCPNALFVGVDIEPMCIAYTAQRIVEAGVPNALAVPGSVESLPTMFAPGELHDVSLNFPTPEPKRRWAHLRLVTADHLALLRPLLALNTSTETLRPAAGSTVAPCGSITFRTDNQPLFSYALPQFKAAGFTLLWTSEDDRAEHSDTPFTEYERRMSAEGARIFALCAAPSGPAPTSAQLHAARELPQSLYDYLPEDLFDGTYTPHGMSYGVANLRNARTKREKTTADESSAL